MFSTGGIRPDGLVLQAGGASRRGAMVRVTTLTGMKQGMLALDGYAASTPGCAWDWRECPWISRGPDGAAGEDWCARM